MDAALPHSNEHDTERLYSSQEAVSRLAAAPASFLTETKPCPSSVVEDEPVHMDQTLPDPLAALLNSPSSSLTSLEDLDVPAADEPMPDLEARPRSQRTASPSSPERAAAATFCVDQTDESSVDSLFPLRSPTVIGGRAPHNHCHGASTIEVVIEATVRPQLLPAARSSSQSIEATADVAEAGPSSAAVARGDEAIARAAAMLPPSPPRRNLRARKAAQLNPYTLEAIRYQRALVRNDWEDALVSQREWARQEKKRVREEAARAAAEAGSVGESQSQWLEPDPDDEAQEENWQREEERGRKRQIYEAKCVERERQRPQAAQTSKGTEAAATATKASKRPISSSTTQPSAYGRLLLLSSGSETEDESLAQAASAAAVPAALTMSSIAGPSRTHPSLPSARPTTYGKRSKDKARAQEPAADAIESRARSHEPNSSGSSSPILGPRKHARIRSLSNVDLVSSDTEPSTLAGRTTATAETLVHREAAAQRATPTVVYIDSSEDETSVIRRTAGSSSKRKKYQEAQSSDSDSTDYERRFRQLKKMMPAGMARKHIEDLKAMRRGKAYHSDGHVSTTPEASEQSQDEDGDATIPAATSTPSTSPLDAGELRPGEARKRLRRRSITEGDHNGLSQLFSADSESESERMSSSDDEMLKLWADRSRPRQIREADAIDRMLSRTNGSRRPRKRAQGSEGAVTRRKPKQGRLDSHLVERANGAASGESHRRMMTTASAKVKSMSSARTSSASGFKKKRKKHNPRVGRIRSTHRGPAPRPSNPAIVKPRTRSRLDMINDDVFFDFQIQSALDGRAADDSDDDLMSMLGDHSAVARPLQMLAQAAELGEGAVAAGARGPGGGGAMEARRFRRSVSGGSHTACDHIANDAAMHTPSPLRHLDNLPPVSPGRPPPRPGFLHARVTPLAKSPGLDVWLAAAVSSPASKSPTTIAAIAQADAQRIEAEAWDDHEGLRVDFGIEPLPIGLSFADHTFLGRGRLYELLHLPDYLDEPGKALPPNWLRLSARVGEVELTATMAADEVIASIPVLFETLARETELGEDDADLVHRHPQGQTTREGAGLEEGSRFLCLRLTAEALQLELSPQLSRLYRAITNQIDLLFQRLRKKKAMSLESLIRLVWFRVEICWRMLATCGQDHTAMALQSQDFATFRELANSSKLLMLLLLRHGLHRTMRAVKAVAKPLHDDAGFDQSAEDGCALSNGAKKLTDTSAEVWVCLIHLLDHAGRQDMGGELISFWSVFEAALGQWQGADPKRRSVVASESTWYCIFSLSALSTVSASTGSVFSTSHLGEHWPIVAKALAKVRLRFDDQVESSMSLPALNKRDQYVWVLLRRCLDLNAIWHWKMEGAELALSRLFEVFDSHKLTDLPSESDHDFPQFLREFDEDALFEGATRDDSSFHLFIKLVARAGRDLRRSASDERDGDRKISRLFSRISPVRAMAFTRSNVPTSSQRSMLFNHYAVVMLFLYLVPSQAQQRLRQIRSFLPFKQADYASQVACVRAMMYAAVVFRHHRLDVSPISAWFGEVTFTMLKEYETLEKTTGTQRRRPGAAPLAPVFEEAQARQTALRRQGEVARLIVAVLRSLQHVIQHPTLSKQQESDFVGHAAYPDLKLLHTAWTKEILEAQLAIDPAIGREALKCIHAFLLQRNKAVATRVKPAVHAATSTSSAAHESQDSFGDLFDDTEFDFEDPTLDNLLGVQEQAAAAAAAADVATVDAPPPQRFTKELDREFADYAIGVISPALFRLVSNLYHPDRRAEGLCISLGVTERLALPEEWRLDRRNRLDHIVKDAERRRYLETVIDCWAGCAHVLVQNGLRGWNGYLTFGNESWKRIDDPIGKRDVGLRFLLNVLVLDPAAFVEHEGEFMAMWCQAAVARVLSVQHNFTAALCKVAPQSAHSVLCHGWKETLVSLSPRTAASQTQTSESAADDDDDDDGPTLKLQDFETVRHELLCVTLSNISRDAEREDTAALKRRPMLFSCLSALLSAVRLYVEDTPREAKERSTYLAFCRAVLREVQARIRGDLMRGIGGEVALTLATLERHSQAPGQG